MKSLCGVLAALLLLGCAGCGAPAVSPAAVAAASSAEGVLRAAIASRAAVAFTYSGVSRVAHPHRMGPSAAKNGKVLVRCWEVTRGGAPTGRWKLYDAAKISDPRLLSGAPFAPAPGYTPRDRAIPAPSAEIEITKDTKGETADFADFEQIEGVLPHAGLPG